MKTKGNSKILFVSCLIMIALFNLIIFLIPNEIMGVTRFDKPVFWVSYAFMMLCLIVQGVIDYKFSKIEEVGEKMFLNIPLIRTGYIALVVSVVIAILFMVIPVLPAWIGAIVCVLLTAFLILAVVRANTVATAIEEVGDKVAKKTFDMKMAVADAKTICDMASEDKKADANRLYDALRYSDYMTCDEVAELDNNIKSGLSDIKTNISSSTIDDFKLAVDNLILIIKERNTKVKMFKK